MATDTLIKGSKIGGIIVEILGIATDILSMRKISSFSSKIGVKEKPAEEKKDKEPSKTDIHFGSFGRGDEIALGSILIRLSNDQQWVMENFLKWLYKYDALKANIFCSHFAYEYEADKNEAQKKMSELASIGVRSGNNVNTYKKMFAYCESKRYTKNSTIDFVSALGQSVLKKVKEVDDNIPDNLGKSMLKKSKKFAEEQRKKFYTTLKCRNRRK